ncbi:MAG: DUF6428 family protein [Verrucomicrobiales bacterium]|nr:DUF6428 family protein [Verrucomicrobiales bacterium]
MKTTNPTNTDLVEILESANPESLRMILPDGKVVPAHFHVTEVGRVRKDFIDCGGTVRQDAHCQLQLLVATDFEHRLAPAKLLKIIEMSQPILGDEPLSLTVEYGQKVAVVYPVSALEVEDGVLRFSLETPVTACLAADACGLSFEEAGSPKSAAEACCAPGSGCC